MTMSRVSVEEERSREQEEKKHRVSIKVKRGGEERRREMVKESLVTSGHQ